LSAHHWPHPQKALQEFWRVLRPGGQLILSDIVSFDDFTADTFLQTLELLRDPSHVRDHTLAQWLQMFGEAGFSAQVNFRLGVWIDFHSWVKRMATPPLHVEMLQALFAGAADEVRRALQLEANCDFTFQAAVIRGLRNAEA
jgi:SAM-dependent methyltransferase